MGPGMNRKAHIVAVSLRLSPLKDILTTVTISPIACREGANGGLTRYRETMQT